VKSEFRTITGALEAYHADFCHYPPWTSHGVSINSTNGTISKGDIVLVGPKSSYAGNHLYPDKVE